MSEDSLAQVTKDGEHQRLEFKTRLSEGAVAERVVLGMANTEGGTLLVGVDDEGHVVGLTDDDYAVARSILDGLYETYPDLTCEVSELTVEHRKVFSIEVQPVPDIQYQLADRSGRIWRRDGALTRKVAPVDRGISAKDNGDADFQVYRSHQRLPFGALRTALQNIQPRCAYPGCEVTDPLEVASISSPQPGGPRYDSDRSAQSRHSLRNFFLLCPNHHVIVDRDSATHPLNWMLDAREEWLNLGPEAPASAPDPPTCFLSYAWEDEEHVRWVAQLANDLQSKMGVAVLLDSWALRPGDSITQFMERAVEESDFVAMVLTPAYAKRAKAREGGVGYEGGIVTGVMLEGRDPRRSVPILRDDPAECVPAFLKGKMYIDFRKDMEYSNNLESLGRAIHNAPKFRPPPIGKPPWETDTA